MSIVKYEDMLNYCIREVKKVPSGIKFTVPDLFKKYEWDNMKLDKGNKGQLGKDFNKEVNIGCLINLVKDLNIKREELHRLESGKSNYLREIYKKI